MLREIDNFYLRQEEPIRSCLYALRHLIIQYNDKITEAWKYKMPFFCYKGKMFCYIWIDNKGIPYIGIVEGRKIDHPLLIKGDRSRMKVLFIDPSKDLPIEVIQEVFSAAILLYK